MKRKFFLAICFLMTLGSTVSAQDDEGAITYGLKLGATYASISGLETTILSERDKFRNFTLEKKPRFGWAGGMFLNYRFHPIVALHAEVMYARQGSNLVFNNTVYRTDTTHFNYKIQFRYQYLNVLGLMKFYPWGNRENGWNRLSIGVGPQLGFNLASQNIIYTSGGTGKDSLFGPDSQIQQQLRNVLKGKSDFGFLVGLGYEFQNIGLTIDARYQMAVTDAVETLANPYKFIENKNRHTAFQLSAGWDFTFFK